MFKLLGRLLVVLASVWAGSASAAHMSTIFVDGKEWLQPLDFTYTSWDSINSVCNAAAGGYCIGSIGSNNLTGWTWASINDMNALLNSFSGSEVLGPGPSNGWGTGGYQFSSLFMPTSNQYDNDPYTMGWTRNSVINPIYGLLGTFTTSTNLYVDGVATDSLWNRTDMTAGHDHSGYNLGGWFFRTADIPVPTPDTLPLLGLALAALGFSRRKRIKL